MGSQLKLICQAIRDILSDDEAMETLLEDTKKPGEAFIGNKPLNWKQLIKDYNLSVHHTCREKPINKDGVVQLKGIVYIDLSRKIAPKSDLDVMDELDTFAWDILDVLYNEFPDLNGTVDEWQFVDKGIWRPSNSGTGSTIEEKLLNYICQITLTCDYYYSNRDY